jgi:hypothetical protein
LKRLASTGPGGRWLELDNTLESIPARSGQHY